MPKKNRTPERGSTSFWTKLLDSRLRIERRSGPHGTHTVIDASQLAAILAVILILVIIALIRPTIGG